MIRIRWASMKDPVVHVEDLKAWLKAKRVTVSQMATADAAAHHNALIRELLQEIENAEKGAP